MGRVVVDSKGAKPRSSLFDGIMVVLPVAYVVCVFPGYCRCDVERKKEATISNPVVGINPNIHCRSCRSKHLRPRS